MRVLSLFSGIGAFEKALERLHIDFELVNYCEIDKYASKAYSLIHNVSEDLNLKDVTKVDCNNLKDIDLLTYAFPCQDISIAGHKKGLLDTNGNTTRSGLVFEALDIIEKLKPKYAVCENVKMLASKRFSEEFDFILDCLDKMGYNNYWKVLNASDYGIPQNRERVFIVSIRKDIDKGFTFPAPFTLTKRLKDFLEDNVDEKYYLSQRIVDYYYNRNIEQEAKGNGFRFEPSDGNRVALTVLSKAGSRPTDNYIRLTELTKGLPQAYRVYDSNGLAKTLNAEAGGVGAKTGLYAIKENGKTDIRRLTPKECFRIFGFEDKDCDICKANKISDTQLYKMAGNSIVVDVLYYIFKNLLEVKND